MRRTQMEKEKQRRRGMGTTEGGISTDMSFALK